jgi:hypothetical protein
MKMYRGVEVKLHIFFDLDTLDGSALPAGKESLVSIR